MEKQEYLYTGTDTQHKSIREPRVKDCIALAHQVLAGLSTPPPPLGKAAHISRSENLYMVGNVSTDFLDSEYARQCLHIVAEPIKLSTADEEIDYLELILGSLLNAGIITARTRAFYGMYVDMDELKNEGERMVGDDIAEDGIRYLQAINFKDRAGAPVSIAAE